MPNQKGSFIGKKLIRKSSRMLLDWSRTSRQQAHLTLVAYKTGSLSHRHVRETRNSGTSPMVGQNKRRTTLTGRYRRAFRCPQDFSTLRPDSLPSRLGPYRVHRPSIRRALRASPGRMPITRREPRPRRAANPVKSGSGQPGPAGGSVLAAAASSDLLAGTIRTELAAAGFVPGVWACWAGG
jgi:hypothetical protein